MRLVSWVLALAIVVAVPARAAEETPIYAVPTRATAAQVRELLRGGFRTDDGALEAPTMYTFLDTGRADFFTGEVPNFRCKSPPRYTVEGRSIRFECQLVRYGGDGTPGDSHWESFQLDIQQLSPNAIVFDEHVGYQARLEWATGMMQDPPTQDQTAEFLAVSTGGGEHFASSFHGAVDTVELVPGARDRALFDAVERRIRSSGMEKENPFDAFTFFEGPPARDPRVESEVFYVGEKNQKTAEEVARGLRTVIGPVVPKPWPGSWRFDVVVVAGSRAAAAPRPESR